MTIYDYAKLYSSLGWSIVPVKRGTKYPALESWKEYQERKPTEEELKTWFEGKENIGIGVITGKISNLTVIDNDLYKPDAVDLKLETPIVAQSGAGGKHGFYQYNPKVSTFKNEEKAIDSRSEGGFIVLPPTIHPSTGKEYRWLTGLPTKEQFAVLTICPDEMEQYRPTPKTKAIDLTTLSNVEIGGRDEAIFNMACLLVYTNKPTEQILFLLQQLNKTFPQPLSERQVIEKLQSALKYKNQENAEHPLGDGSDLRFVNLVPIPLQDISSEHLQINWLWEGYIAKGELTLCSALPKVGKSTLVAHLLKCFQTTDSLAGQPVTKSKVLVISEESKSLWARKREDMELEGDIWVIPQPFKEKPSYKLWVQLIKNSAKFCQENSIDLVVIDTITSFWNVKDEGNAPEVQEALLPLINFTDTGAAVLIVHHHRKSGGDEGVASRGSTAFGSAVSIILEVTRKEKENPNNNQRVLKTYSRFEESPAKIVIELVGDKYETLGTSAEVSKQARLDRILTILPDVPKGMTSQDVLENWDIEELGKKPSRSSIVRYLSELKENGKIKVVCEIIIKRSKTPVYGKVASSQPQKNETQFTPISLGTEGSSDTDDPYKRIPGYWNTIPKNQWPQWKLDQENNGYN